MCYSKCIKCCGDGTIDKVINVTKIDNIIMKVYNRCSCDLCDGKGYIEISEEEYNSLLKTLSKRIEKLELDLLSPEYSTYYISTECEVCKGQGEICSKTIDITPDKYYIITTKLCENCNGKGCIINLEETNKNINYYLELCKKDREELISLNKQLNKTHI